MPKINIPYYQDFFVDPVTKKNSHISRPLIKVRLKYKHKIDKVPTLCLLDSGADNNLFPAQWGEALGIRIEKGIKREHIGIGGAKLTAYTHSVGIYVGSYLINTDIDFSETQIIPLLGRNGFFKHFKNILFDEENKLLVLEH